MAIQDVVSRIAAIEDLVARAQAATAPVAVRAATTTTGVTTTGAAATSPAGSFGAALDGAISSSATGATATWSETGISPEDTGVVLGSDRTLQGVLTPTTAGERALQAARAEIGVAEDPPGSNDAPRIAEYRTATAGSAPGVPWCAYFVSWAARQAGTPIGDEGQGYGAVEQIASWAGRTGRLLPAGSTPSPGDLILFGGRHVGIVESVGADGRLTTVEGNHGNAVQRVQRTIADATGFVRLS